ncbi:MAG: hypothetical protein R2731_03120 [Nocardioides sp.]
MAEELDTGQPPGVTVTGTELLATGDLRVVRLEAVVPRTAAGTDRAWLAAAWAAYLLGYAVAAVVLARELTRRLARREARREARRTPKRGVRGDTV